MAGQGHEPTASFRAPQRHHKPRGRGEGGKREEPTKKGPKSKITTITSTPTSKGLAQEGRPERGKEVSGGEKTYR